MARIIHQCQFDRVELEGMDFGQALRTIKLFMDTDDTLDALIAFEKRYEKAEREAYETDDYGFDREWKYEIYAYNMLVEGFGKMFEQKEVA